MDNYIYRVYLDNCQFTEVVVAAPAPSTGQQIVESQFQGRRVVYMGKKF
jgi:hypothetical protein